MLDLASIQHDMVIKTGHVAQEITKLAKRGRFDMIAVGTKGRSAVADLLLGSVAQHVVATADRPVLVVKCRPVSSWGCNRLSWSASTSRCTSACRTHQ